MILNNSDITPYHLEHEIIGPRITQTYRKLRLEKSTTDDYIVLLMGYARSPFRDFESYLRIVVGLDEDDIRLILKQYIEKIITYELSSKIYSMEDNSKAVYTMGDHEGTLQLEFDNDTMKAKPILTRFGSTFGTLRFDEHFILNTLLGFTPYWDYKPTNAIHADSSGIYTSDEFLKLNTINKIHLKCDVIGGSIHNVL